MPCMYFSRIYSNPITPMIQRADMLGQMPNYMIGYGTTTNKIQGSFWIPNS
ncbi:unnamed protein product [Debaryomyces tyrocola]|nr:unnamed protein product [Debaryomyces tyrocola]